MVANIPKRPLGITILMLLTFFVAIYYLSVAYGLSLAGSYYLIVGILYLVLSIIGVMVIYGYWTRIKWGWTLAILYPILIILVTFLSVLINPISTVINVLVKAVLASVVIYYLTRKNVKAYFITK